MKLNWYNISVIWYFRTMIKENLYEPFSIAYKTIDACPKLAHQHRFFELIYIISGTGKQCINKNSFSYRAGHMFLITPEDCHSLDVETTTKLFFLRFNDIYLKRQWHINRERSTAGVYIAQCQSPAGLYP